MMVLGVQDFLGSFLIPVVEEETLIYLQIKSEIR